MVYQRGVGLEVVLDTCFVKNEEKDNPKQLKLEENRISFHSAYLRFTDGGEGISPFFIDLVTTDKS